MSLFKDEFTEVNNEAYQGATQEYDEIELFGDFQRTDSILMCM